MTSDHRPLNGFAVVRSYCVRAWRFLCFVNLLLWTSRELFVVSVRLKRPPPYLILRLPYPPRWWKCRYTCLVSGTGSMAVVSQYGLGRCASSRHDSKFTLRHGCWVLNLSECYVGPTELSGNFCNSIFLIGRHAVSLFWG